MLVDDIFLANISLGYFWMIIDMIIFFFVDIG